jgi:putative restriction endonuclease
VLSLTKAIENLYTLNVGVTSAGDGTRHERPHKPLLLLAVLDLLDEGLATPHRIPWCDELRKRFTRRFEMVRRHNDKDTPENPFRRLQNEDFWSAWKNEAAGRQPLKHTPLVKEVGYVFAAFTNGFDILVALPENRMLMREALVARYFPGQAESLLGPMTPQEENPAKVAEESIDFGRNPGFRQKIIEVYDHQCAACGLRIRLPQAKDVSFIDAAHLVPFAESHNDHPTNGLALCKNHHWAMDRHLIAPGPDMVWHVSPVLQAHRSSGEKELLELAKRAVLPPREAAFRPDEGGLEWRLKRLIAS